MVDITKPLSFKVNSEEEKIIRDYAKSKSLPVATMCRFVILEKIKGEILNKSK